MKEIEIPEFKEVQGLRVWEADDCFVFKLPNYMHMTYPKMYYHTYKGALKAFVSWCDGIDHNAFFENNREWLNQCDEK
jgi:hypothetical protein